MACNKCGQGLVVCVDSTQPNGGSFREEYECNVCGAQGFIHGSESERPNQWRKTGEVF